MTVYYIAKFYDFEPIYNARLESFEKALLFFNEKYKTSFYERKDRELSIIGSNGDKLWLVA